MYTIEDLKNNSQVYIKSSENIHSVPERLFEFIQSNAGYYTAVPFRDTLNFWQSFNCIRYYHTVYYDEGASKVAFRVFRQVNGYLSDHRREILRSYVRTLDEYTELVDEFTCGSILIFTCKIPHRSVVMDKSDLDAELDITFI